MSQEKEKFAQMSPDERAKYLERNKPKIEARRHLSQENMIKKEEEKVETPTAPAAPTPPKPNNPNRPIPPQFKRSVENQNTTERKTETSNIVKPLEGKTENNSDWLNKEGATGNALREFQKTEREANTTNREIQRSIGNNTQNNNIVPINNTNNNQKTSEVKLPSTGWITQSVFQPSSKWKESEAASVHALQNIAHKKVEEQKDIINTKKEDLEKELNEKLEALNAEKAKYESLGKTNLVEAIDKKIASYTKTKELLDANKIEQNDINKLHNFIAKDIDNLAPDAKIKQYDMVASKLDNFNQKQEIRENKVEVKAELNELNNSKNVVDEAMNNIRLDVEQQTVVLEEEIAQLMARAQTWDVEKAQELQERVNQYKNFTQKSDDEYTVGEKKWLVMFLQSDEQKHNYLENQRKYWDLSVDSVVWSAAGMLATWVIAWETLKTMGTGLIMNKAYSLFGEFWAIRNSIPWLANLSPSDNIDEYVANIKNYTFSDEEKAKIEELKMIQWSINNFQEVQKSIIEEVNQKAFLEQRMALEFQLAENKKYLDSEIAKIDMMNFSDEEKTKQKEMLLQTAGTEEAKLREQLSVINQWTDELTKLENTELLSKEQIDKLSTQTDILALTQDPANKALLTALAAEWIDGRMIGWNLEVDINKVRDFSLIASQQQALEALNSAGLNNKKDTIKTGLQEFWDVFIWKKWETDLERKERFKLMDNYLSSWATGMLGKVMLFLYQSFEMFINSVEKLPAYIVASQHIIERNRSGIFIAVTIFVLVLTLWFSWNESMSFIELNSKLYSMSNYSLESTGNMRYADETVQSVSQKLWILTFLMSLVILYQIIIEIMNKYIQFIKSWEDKSRVEGFMLSLLKWLLFLVFLGTVFKVFV